MSTHREFECNESHRNQTAKKLTAMGLAELPPLLDGEHWTINADRIIRQPNGMAVICRNGWERHIADTLSQLLQKEITHKTSKTEGGNLAYFVSYESITVPERHTIATMTRYFDTNLPGVSADSSYITFPKAMSTYGTASEYACEEDAYEAAEVLSVVTQLQGDVRQSDTGYSVVLHAPHGDLDDYKCALAMGVCVVLDYFHCVPKVKSQAPSNLKDCDVDHWQGCMAERYNQQRRIEDGINAILAHLTGQTDEGLADSIATGRELLENIEASAEVRRADKTAAKSGKVKKTAARKGVA